MKIWGSANVLSEQEMEKIDNGMLAICSQVGFKVEHAKIRERLSDAGAKVKGELVCFTEEWMRNFLKESERTDLDLSGQVECFAGAYPLRYLALGSKKSVLHTMETVINMTRLADYLENIDCIYSAMGVPSDVPGRVIPLYQRLITWKYHKRIGKSRHEYRFFHDGCEEVTDPNLCPFVQEMAEEMAAGEGGVFQDYCYAGLSMISPLTFRNTEAEIFMFMAERNCGTAVGSILSMGGSAPVTFAASMPLQMAECMFRNILQRVFYGDRALIISNSMLPMDMKAGLFLFGRPELNMTNLATGQMARRYGALYFCQSMLGDAKLPSSELGMQKASNAVSAILAGSKALGTAGMISIDEIGSPEQLIIDAEFAGSLKRMARHEEILKESDELEMIKRVGPGGYFMGEMHTAEHFRDHWEPSFFAREMLPGWEEKGSRLDVDYAREIYEKMLREHDKIYIKSSTEEKLMKIIKKAESKLG